MIKTSLKRRRRRGVNRLKKRKRVYVNKIFMNINNSTSKINKDKQENDLDDGRTRDGEELKKKIKELLDYRHKQLHDQIKTMMEEHVAKLESVKRTVLLEYEQSKRDGDLNDESLKTLLRREKEEE